MGAECQLVKEVRGDLLKPRRDKDRFVGGMVGRAPGALQPCNIAKIGH